MKWIFETGDSRSTGKGETWQEAIKRAWAKNPPKEIGILVEITPPQGETCYCSAEAALKAAGYRLEEKPL